MKKVASSSSSMLIIVFIVLAIILLFSSMFGSSGLAGYSLDNSSLHPSSIEPFDGTHSSYASYPSNVNIDAGESMLIKKRKMQDVEPIGGFDGLYGSSEYPNNNLDVFKTAVGSTDPQCFATASGLSNSRGALCLDNTQLSLLRTRGGNQTSSASVIGGSDV